MEYNKQKEISEAIQAANNTLSYLREAERHLKSASNWGIVDILGGGAISGIAKHAKLNDAKLAMERAKYAIKDFKKEVQDVRDMQEISLDVGDFLTFADFFFDGLVADLLVQSKIKSTQKQLSDAIVKVETIKLQLMAIM